MTFKSLSGFFNISSVFKQGYAACGALDTAGGISYLFSTGPLERAAPATITGGEIRRLDEGFQEEFFDWETQGMARKRLFFYSSTVTLPYITLWMKQM